MFTTPERKTKMKTNELNRRDFMRLGVAAAALPGILKAQQAPAKAAAPAIAAP